MKQDPLKNQFSNVRNNKSIHHHFVSHKIWVFVCCKTFHQEEVPGTEIEDLNFSQSGSLITVPVVIYEDESDDEDDLIDDGEKDTNITWQDSSSENNKFINLTSDDRMQMCLFAYLIGFVAYRIKKFKWKHNFDTHL